MALAFLNACGFRPVAFTSVDDFVVAAAATGYYAPADCLQPAVVDGATYHYSAVSDDGTQTEEGDAVWDDVLQKLLRATGTVRNSSAAGALVTFSAAPRVLMGGATANDWPFSGFAADGEPGASIIILAGSGGDGGGSVQFGAGNGVTAPGGVTLVGGNASAGQGGGAGLTGGNGSTSGGSADLTGGLGDTADGGNANATGGDGLNGGDVALTGGDATEENGGAIMLNPGTGVVDGGDVLVALPSAGSGRQGMFIVGNLPTVDPEVVNALWVDGTTIKISAG